MSTFLVLMVICILCCNIKESVGKILIYYFCDLSVFLTFYCGVFSIKLYTIIFLNY